ncbi:MAG: hypothetical protein U5L96_07075 [Owenweeksia sp.]|nr:hypothetical protein [Owenweeksia sp.]
MYQNGYSPERNTINRFRKNFKGWDDIVFPKVHSSYTTGSIAGGAEVCDFRWKVNPEKSEA